MGSRLKRLSDRIMLDGSDIYNCAQLPFEPRWFPIFRFLTENEKVTLAHIARELGITHPSVHQTLAEMTRAKLVTSFKDSKDKRKRLISLSKKGKELLPLIQPVWDDIRCAMLEVISETGTDVIQVIQKMEDALDRDRFAERFRRIHALHQQNQIEIIGYDPVYRADFERLNRQWISFYFKMEPEDERVFADPEKLILEPGGEIFFARDINSGKVLGTVALIKVNGDHFELAKMAVDPETRGRQIGWRLGQAALQFARDRKLGSLKLFSNTRLVPAINLYKKLGFVMVTSEDMSLYDRANICMIHHLQEFLHTGSTP